jgi:aspartyl-tRNA(Asn)/glutamyl-tRNA(Gln) amidotransferase subunit A
VSALHDLTLAEAADLIRARKLSPVELAAAYQARIAAHAEQLHAFVRRTPDVAHAMAAEAEADIARGDWRGPLHGVPMGFKDLYDVQGLATTAQSALLRDNIADEDAHTVSLLRQAGAVFQGKHTTWEFAVGGTGFDCPWPPARNPWALDRDPGGSSSGSGVSVAAGLSLAALGSDTGGSVRFPAAWCGVAGFKPTYGLVSKRGIFPLAHTLDHAGILARNSTDCALVLEAIAGFDPRDPTSLDGAPSAFRPGDPRLDGVRIGLVSNYLGECVTPEPVTLRALAAATEVFRSLGAEVRNVTLPPLREYAEVGVLISRAEGFSVHEATLKASPHLYGEASRSRLELGAMIRAADYLNAQRLRTLLLHRTALVTDEVDLLLAPTVPGPAPVLAEENPASARERLMYTRPFNLNGAPALSLCAGHDAAGLPLAMQIAGRSMEDALVLRAGAAFETATGFWKRRPTGFLA